MKPNDAPAAGYMPLRRARWYKRLHARMLAHGCARYERAVDERKRRLLGSLRGTVVEIGPGPGTNIGFYEPSINWIGIEPNDFMREYIEREASASGMRAEVRRGTAESLPLGDSSADAVVSSLVLCTVHDVSASLQEIRRVLKPGGRFVFIEHVAAERGTVTRRVQRLIRPLWQVLGDGCHPDRDTLTSVRDAGFTRVEAEQFRAPVPIIGPHIAGTAIR